jgi:hypothetical protein
MPLIKLRFSVSKQNMITVNIRTCYGFLVVNMHNFLALQVKVDNTYTT